LSSEPIEPTRVWTEEEWKREQPWGAMPNSELRRYFKTEAFIFLYSGGPRKIEEIYRRYGGQ
jgi:hypothetical protein